MKTYRLGVLYGDGIGPEIVRATVATLDAAAKQRDGLRFEWVELPMGWDGIRQHGEVLPQVTKRELAACDGWLMGPHDSASYPAEYQAQRNPSGELRHHFDLFANIRPARNYPGVAGLVGGVDLVIVRENTEEFYPDRNMYLGTGEWMPTPDVALSVGVFTRAAATRIAHAAFRLAMGRRKSVSIVHKANVIKLGMGLFLDSCRAVAAAYPEVRVDDYHVDALAAHLVRRAADFDVIVTTNMAGDILSDLAAELAGGLGLAPSLNAGADRAMAQAAHGSAPDLAGRDLANPVGEILSAVLLLRWLAERHADGGLLAVGECVESALLRTLAAGVRTRDLGGDAGTALFTAAIIARLAAPDGEGAPTGHDLDP